jgi:uncharacterized membrane protein
MCQQRCNYFTGSQQLQSMGPRIWSFDSDQGGGESLQIGWIVFSIGGRALKGAWSHWLAGGRAGPVVTGVSERRSVAKAITYRTLVMIADFVAIYLMTGALKVAVGFTIISNIYTTVIYFLHERAWARSKWGLTSRR